MNATGVREIVGNIGKGDTVHLLPAANADSARATRIAATLRTLLEEKGVRVYSIQINPIESETQPHLKEPADVFASAEGWIVRIISSP